MRTEARFDDFMNGDLQVLSAQELDGLDTFLSVNCVRCHDGAAETLTEAVKLMGHIQLDTQISDQETADII